MDQTSEADDANRTTRVRAHLEGLIAASRTPGLQYVIVDPLHTLLSFAGGSADIRTGRSLEPTTTMMAYSMSKTITAAAILRLVSVGRLSLDDPADRHVRGLPYGPGVTIRGLLGHTAGVPAPIPLKWVHLASAHQSFDESGALAAVLRRHNSLTSQPGTRFSYSNLGYWLLGAVIENVTGEPFTAFVEREILAPLGIDPRQLSYRIVDPARHATGYLAKYSLMNLVKGFLIENEFIGGYDGRWLRITAHYLNGPAFGGLVGTSEGMSRFLQDQLRAESVLLSAEARTVFYQQQAVASGDRIPMTPGWHIGALNGERYYYKEGGGGGFHSMMRLYPAHGIGSVVMANATSFDVAGVLDRLDPEFFGARAH